MGGELTEKEVRLIIAMENYHIGGHLDSFSAGICLHNAGSEHEVFIEEAGDLGIADDRANELIKLYWAVPCHLWEK